MTDSIDWSAHADLRGWIMGSTTRLTLHPNAGFRLHGELEVEAEQAGAQPAALTQLEPKLEATQSRVEELKADCEKLKSP